jgi:hypothetical protein
VERNTEGGYMKESGIIYPVNNDNAIVPVKISDVISFSCCGFEPGIKNPIIVMNISMEGNILPSNKYTQEQAEQILDSFKKSPFMIWEDSGVVYGVQYSAIIGIDPDDGCVSYLRPGGGFEILRSVPPESERNKYQEWREAHAA